MTPSPKYDWAEPKFKAFFHSVDINSKVLNKAYSKGSIKRTKLYFNLYHQGKLYRGYLYYSVKIKCDEQALIHWCKVNSCTLKEAITLLRRRKILTQAQLADVFPDTSTISMLSAHHWFGINRKYIRGKPILYYICSERELEHYVKTKLTDLIYGEKSQYIQAAYDFQNKTIPQLMPKLLGHAPFKTEVYKVSGNGVTYKFDVIALKRFKFLTGQRRAIPVIFEVKNFFITSSRYISLIYFKHKLSECFKNELVMPVVLCLGAEKMIFEKAYSELGIWVRDVRKELKKL